MTVYKIENPTNETTSGHLATTLNQPPVNIADGDKVQIIPEPPTP